MHTAYIVEVAAGYARVMYKKVYVAIGDIIKVSIKESFAEQGRVARDAVIAADGFHRFDENAAVISYMKRYAAGLHPIPEVSCF